MSFINAAAPDVGGTLDWAENQKGKVDQELIQQLTRLARIQRPWMRSRRNSTPRSPISWKASHFAR